MSTRHSGIVKVIVVVVLAVLVAVAFTLMSREQEARRVAEDALAVLNENIDNGLTPEEVHEKIGRQPDETRTPGKHRFVEEYRWQGPMSQTTVYAYYTTGATKLLEAVSMNQQMDDWEGDALDVRQ